MEEHQLRRVFDRIVVVLPRREARRDRARRRRHPGLQHVERVPAVVDEDPAARLRRVDAPVSRVAGRDGRRSRSVSQRQCRTSPIAPERTSSVTRARTGRVLPVVDREERALLLGARAPASPRELLGREHERLLAEDVEASARAPRARARRASRAACRCPRSRGVSRESSSSADPYHRASGSAARNGSSRSGRSSAAATISTSPRSFQAGTWPLTATCPTPRIAPFSMDASRRQGEVVPRGRPTDPRDTRR